MKIHLFAITQHFIYLNSILRKLLTPIIDLEYVKIKKKKSDNNSLYENVSKLKLALINLRLDNYCLDSSLVTAIFFKNNNSNLSQCVFFFIKGKEIKLTFLVTIINHNRLQI